jgi:hypothetical protein
MGDGGGRDHPCRFELHRVGPEPVEEADAVAQKRGDQVDLQLVEQSRLQVLLNDARAAGERDVLVAGGCPSLLERGFIPSVTKVNEVPPCLFTVSRA